MTVTSTDYVASDFASGDSFFRSTSRPSRAGPGFRLSAAGHDSEPFDVDATNPYGRLAEESFDYFKDHRAPETVFDKFLRDWTTGRIAGPFWYDAGDKGSYPTNTAIAAWALMNLYEKWPEANATLGGKATLYEEVKVGAALMHQLILPGQKLAVAKLHTNVRRGDLPAAHDGPVRVDGGDEGHVRDGADARAARADAPREAAGRGERAFDFARTALTDARSEPRSCRGFEDFGGEGGLTRQRPRALWRQSGKHREPSTPAATTSRTTAMRLSSRCSWRRRRSATRARPRSGRRSPTTRASARSRSPGGTRRRRPATSRCSR